MIEINSMEILLAIHAGDISRFDSFLASGLDVNTKTVREKWNFLHRALVSVRQKPIPSMIEFLVKRGVDVNARDFHMWTPLHFAARIKNVDAMRILLDGGAEIDPVNDEGVTPLRMTILTMPINRAATELLLSRGANAEHKGKGASVRDFAKLIAHGENAGLIEVFNRFS
jgi:hypothetical protein